MPRSQFPVSMIRRANTIVFVMSILVLLVIIATAFVTRAKAGRQIATAQQAASGRDGRSDSLSRDVAKEISASLFPKPIDPNDAFGQFDNTTTPPTTVGSASWPRLATPQFATRYETDRDNDGDAFPDFPTNTTAYEVKPWTNWPDDFLSPISAWPRGVGAPNGQLLTLTGAPLGDSNPYGNPGTGDTRWLRSTEPQRADFNADGVPDGFSHWTHLTWLPSANNAWRAVRDIADIEGTTLINLNQNDLTKALGVAVPYEQWLSNVPPVGFVSAADLLTSFPTRRDQWFAPPSAATWYGLNYRLPSALPNFFQLAALGPASDEWQPNTARQMISRTFTDADGDGYTDSFWFLAPSPVDRGVRTIVGVSIIDNSSMLNVNIATKGGFFETAVNATGITVPGGGSTGQTPADLALVWSKNDLQNRSGVLDTPINTANDYTDPAAIPYFPDYFPSLWSGQGAQLFKIGNGTSINASVDFGRGSNGLQSGSADLYGDLATVAAGAVDFSVLRSLGIKDMNIAQRALAANLGYPIVDPDVFAILPGEVGRFELPSERLAWFKLAGIDPNGSLASTLGLRPFSTADEIELRMAAGLNQPYTQSRLEQAFSLFSPTVLAGNANRFQMLRATVQREEANRELEPLSQRELLVDMRHRITTVNGARNDQLPAWLWPTPYYNATRNYLHPRNAAITSTSDPLYAAFDIENRAEYARQKQKVDLRRPMFALEDGTAVTPAVREAREQQWRNDLARLLERSVSFAGDEDADGVADHWHSYFDSVDPAATGIDPEEQYNKTLSMIASYSANLHSASDQPTKAPAATATVWYDPPTVATPASGNPESQFKPGLDHVVFDPIKQGRFYNGMEKQPFIMEVFIGVVYPKSKIDQNDWNTEFAMCGPVEAISNPQLKLPTTVADGGGETFVDDTSKPAAVIAVQIANPYDTPLPLFDFEIQFYGRSYSFATGQYGFVPVLPPATSAGPATAIIYAVPDYIYSDSTEAATPPANPSSAQTELLISQKMLDFLDIETAPTDLDSDGDANGTFSVKEYIGLYDSHSTGATDPFDAQDRTLVFNATGAWHCKQNDPIAATYQSNSTEPVTLVRRVATAGGIVRMVVDRLENDVSGDEDSFRAEVRRLFTDPSLTPPAKKYKCRMGEKEVDGIRIGQNDLFMTYARCARPWMWDPQSWVRNPTGQWESLAQTANATSICSRDVDSWEINPRYVFSTHSVPIRSGTVSATGVVGRQWDGIISGGDEEFVGDAMTILAADDPDSNAGYGSGPKRSLWPRAAFMDIFGRNIRAKPTFFSMQTVTAEEDCSNPNPGMVFDAVYSDGTGPLPFLRNAETFGAVIDPGSYGIGHARITWNSTPYDVVVGNKGASDADWKRWLDNNVAAGADKYLSLRVPLQLTQRDDDFEQVGEVLDVFLWGHVYENPGNAPTCVATFSEIMLNADPSSEFPVGKGPFVNRLHARAPGEQSVYDNSGTLLVEDFGTQVLGARWDYRHDPPEPDLSFIPGQPALPMGVSWLEALVCDGNGRGTLDRNGDNLVDAIDDPWLERRRFALAGDFFGTKTPGLININTAPLEVLRSMPLMTRLPKYDLTNALLPWVYVRVPDSIVKYRDGTSATDNAGNALVTDVIRPSTVLPGDMPSYLDRGLTQAELVGAGNPAALFPLAPRFYPGMRAEKGFATPAELLLMRRTGFIDPTIAVNDLSIRQSYSSQFFALDPYDLTNTARDPGEFLDLAIDQVPGYRFSADRQTPKARFAPTDTLQASFPALLNLPVRWDEPLGDAEDATLAYKAISNLVTTRSDVFTVYLKVRQVKQDPVTRKWDATKAEHVIDDTRYVMVVDRSECNAPSDQPKILFFEKCSTN